MRPNKAADRRGLLKDSTVIFGPETDIFLAEISLTPLDSTSGYTYALDEKLPTTLNDLKTVEAEVIGVPQDVSSISLHFTNTQT